MLYVFCSYDKTEDLETVEDFEQFTHLLLEVSSAEMPEVDRFNTTHEVLFVQDAFSHVRLNDLWSWLRLKPFEIAMQPKGVILRKLEEDETL